MHQSPALWIAQDAERVHRRTDGVWTFLRLKAPDKARDIYPQRAVKWAGRGLQAKPSTVTFNWRAKRKQGWDHCNPSHFLQRGHTVSLAPAQTLGWQLISTSSMLRRCFYPVLSGFPPIVEGKACKDKGCVPSACNSDTYEEVSRYFLVAHMLKWMNVCVWFCPNCLPTP